MGDHEKKKKKRGHSKKNLTQYSTKGRRQGGGEASVRRGLERK